MSHTCVRDYRLKNQSKKVFKKKTIHQIHKRYRNICHRDSHTLNFDVPELHWHLFSIIKYHCSNYRVYLNANNNIDAYLCILPTLVQWVSHNCVLNVCWDVQRIGTKKKVLCRVSKFARIIEIVIEEDRWISARRVIREVRVVGAVRRAVRAPIEAGAAARCPSP